MNRCEEYQELISRMIDDELTADEVSVLAEHLKTCADCAVVFKAFSALSNSTKETMADLPQGLHEQIVAGARRQHIKNANKSKRKPIRNLIAAAACLVLVVGVTMAFGAPGVLLASSAKNAEESAAFDVQAETRSAAPPEQLQFSGEADVVVGGGAEAPDGEPEAPVEAAAEDGFDAGNPLSLMMAAPTCLEADAWEGLRASLAGSKTDLTVEALADAVYCGFDVRLGDAICSVTVYYHEEIAYFYDPADANIYLSACNLEQLQLLLTEYGV